jgi:uncharacterized protein (TIGR04255 family)
MVSGSFKIEETQFRTNINKPDILGYIFESSDKKRLVQYRRNGFTFNCLKPDPDEPWIGWDSVREEAKELWHLYTNAIKVKMDSVERIAVRYINKIVIKPKGKETDTGVELNDYLTIPPQIPTELPQVLDNHFSRVEFYYPEVKGKGIIILAPHSEKSSDSINLNLDIEVFRVGTMPLDSDLIWSSLDQFRNAKNKIFMACLTDKGRRLFL